MYATAGPGLGDVGSDIAAELQRLRDLAASAQAQANALAQRIQAAGAGAVQFSNQVTGAAAGAKAGYSAGGATWVVPVVVIGSLLWLGRGRR